jgi:hypothetical protein
MKAIVQDRYGSPDTLQLREVDKPVAADNEALVRVHAAAVNAYDWHVMRGDPYLARLAFGPRRAQEEDPGQGLRRPGGSGRPQYATAFGPCSDVNVMAHLPVRPCQL